MRICRLCNSEYPDYSISKEILSTIGGNVGTDCCPACIDVAARKSGLVISWTASFGGASSMHEEKPSMVSVPKLPATYHSEWGTCNICGTDTVLNGRCTNPKHESLELS